MPFCDLCQIFSVCYNMPNKKVFLAQTVGLNYEQTLKVIY